MRALTPSILPRARQEPAVLVFALALTAICLEYVLVPALNTVTPAVSCAILLLLLLRHTPPEIFMSRTNADVSGWRILLFLSLHLAAASVIWVSSRMGETVSAKDSLPNIGIAAAKYLVLAPTIVLLSMPGWRRFHRLYRAEWVAATIALLTLYPYRIFEAAWPWYSQALGHVVYMLALPFVSGLQYISLPSPVLVGPKLEVSILFWCSGLEAIKLFQIVFAVMLVAEWPTISRRRALVGYFAGLALMLAANVARIALLVVAGNRVPEFVMQHHVTAGWIFFAAVLAGFILVAYNWLTSPSGDQTAGNTASLIRPGLRSASQ